MGCSVVEEDGAVSAFTVTIAGLSLVGDDGFCLFTGG